MGHTFHHYQHEALVMHEQPSISKPRRFYHRLDGHFDGKTDAEVIADLNSYESMHEWAKRVLGASSRSTSEFGHHPTIYHYLKRHRPKILQSVETEAQRVAKHWPNNYKDLEALFSRADWESSAIKRRFRAIVRDERMEHAGPQEWWDLIRPQALQVIDVYLQREMAAYEIEPLLWMALHMPSRIFQNDAKGNRIRKLSPKTNKMVDYSVHHALKMLIRQQIADRIKQLSEAS